MNLFGWFSSLFTMSNPTGDILRATKLRTIAVIEGCSWDEYTDGTIRVRARCRIDNDGTGNSHGDKYHQSDTSLHFRGQPLNADVDHYVVIPVAIARAVKGKVLGCRVTVVNTTNGKSDECVCGDGGPNDRSGEVAEITAETLGVNPDPVRGGDDRPLFDYVYYPDTPANCHGRSYSLQSI